MGIGRGTGVGEVVELMDVMPTFLDAAGAPIPRTVEGQSLLPLARGERPTWREYIHGEHESPLGMQYMTDGKDKYIWHWKTDEEQLFDLSVDPRECVNLARRPEYGERVRLWRERMMAHLEPRGGDVVERLKARA